MRPSATFPSLFLCAGTLALIARLLWLPIAAAASNHRHHHSEEVKEEHYEDGLLLLHDDGLEPPANPHLVPRSPWPMTHRNPYCQQSTPWPGPTARDDLEVEFLFTAPGTSTVLYDDPTRCNDYSATTSAGGGAEADHSNSNNSNSNGSATTILWTHNPFHTGRLLRRANSRERLRRLDAIGNFTLDVLSGAYYFLDRGGVLYAARERAVRAFAGAPSGGSGSGGREPANAQASVTTKLREFALPDEDHDEETRRDPKKKKNRRRRQRDDSIVGLNLLYDGYMVYATAQGAVGVLRRVDFGEHYSLRLAGDDDEEEESISNMMAVDEEHGIYVVTSAKLYRVQWNNDDNSSGSGRNNKSLTVAWSSAYDSGPRTGGRLGEGSGTTPTLMGRNRENEHKLVLITDAAPLMHLLAYWRDAIPGDWQPLAAGLDRRLAARVPLQFGDPRAAASGTEQSVVVRGYGALVVNNDYGRALRNWPSWTPDLAHQLSVLLTNLPGIAPRGVEKFEWNPAKRQLERAWVNRDVSCPNGVPAMSAASNLAYCIGQRRGQWNLEAVDWTTGESAFFQPSGYLPIYNSAFSCLIIGMDREILSGGMAGITRFKVKASVTAGGIEEGSDTGENDEDSPAESSEKDL